MVITMKITWHRYPVLPMPLLRTYADSVNDNKFLGCDKGTVFFAGPRTVREKMTDGTVTQKVEMTFKWREVDWNKFMRDDSNAFDFVVSKDAAIGGGTAPTGSTTYTYRDFSKLLL